MQRKLILLALILALTPVGIAVAQSSTNHVTAYITQRFVTMGGGAAESASYSVTSVIGQPVTDVVDSLNYKVSGGFLYPQRQDAEVDNQIWLPVIFK